MPPKLNVLERWGMGSSSISEEHEIYDLQVELLVRITSIPLVGLISSCQSGTNTSPANTISTPDVTQLSTHRAAMYGDSDVVVSRTKMVAEQLPSVPPPLELLIFHIVCHRRFLDIQICRTRLRPIPPLSHDPFRSRRMYDSRFHPRFLPT